MPVFFYFKAFCGTRTVGEIQSETTQRSEEIEPVCEGKAVAVPPEEPFIKRGESLFFLCVFILWNENLTERQNCGSNLKVDCKG